MRNVDIDLKDAKRLHRELDTFAKRAVPHAVRNGLNRSAFATRKAWQGEIRSSFTTRNKFTERSVRVEKARGLNARGMFAVVGSVAPYMAKQEFGGVVSKGGKKPIPLPTAAGQGHGARPRTSTVKPRFRLTSIRLTARGKRKGGQRQRNAAAIKQARTSGKKFVFLQTGRRRGIFRIRGKTRKSKLELLWNLSESSVRVAPEPTLGRTLKHMRPKVERIYRGAFVQQLKRHRLLGF